jgi:hypothetical protein
MISRKSVGATAIGLAAGTVIAVRRVQARSTAPSGPDRWLTVTINCGQEELSPEKLPAPLQEYGERIETRIHPAPGDRGTELAVRLRGPQPQSSRTVTARLAGDDPRQDLRRALRAAKALLEAGEELQPDAPPTTRDTPGGKLVGLLSRRASGEGVL